MQDRYVGDIGDFIKLALLRKLRPGHQLGVAWWLYPDETHNADGRHVAYLQRPSEWRDLDPHLFDGLARIVVLEDRRVSALQRAGFLPDTVFCNELIPTKGSPAERKVARKAWFGRMRAAFADCDLIFLDPDNGLETAGFSRGAKAAGKCVGLAELADLSGLGRTLVVYHHQTRRKGGHLEEIEYWAGRLRGKGFGVVDVIRSSPYSARAFFLLDASPDLRRRAYEFASQWSPRLSWHPDALAAALDFDTLAAIEDADEETIEPVWDGLVRSNMLSDDENRIRHDLADAAKNYSWDHVLSVLCHYNNLTNTTRPDGASFYAPLHQAAYGGAPVSIVRSLLDLGAWRTLQNSRGERPIDVAEQRGHTHLLDALEPDLKKRVPMETLFKIQKHFHAVINGRAQDMVRRAGLRLPQLAPLLEFEDVKFWFPIPGMAGGFAYGFASEGTDAVLVCDSWCRMVDGSGERHEITSLGSRLVEVGFV